VSRAQTLVLALLLMCALMGGLSWVVARSARKSPALLHWAWGTLLFGQGLLITLLPLPMEMRQLSLFVGNSLISWAPVWAARGCLAYCAKQISRYWSHVSLLATIAVLAINAMTWRLPVINLAVPTQIAIGLFVVGGYNLWRAPVADAENASRFLAIAMWLSALDWLLRTAFVVSILGVSVDRERVDLTISLFAIVQILLLVASTMAIFWIEVRSMEAALTRMAFADPLTELPNRRAALQRFQEEQARARRQQRSLALLVMDLDHFKRVNDSYGHHVGDAVLRHVAQVLSREKRSGDFLARIGGEEFVLLLQIDHPEEALEAADRLRILLAATHCVFEGVQHQVTFSGGLAIFDADGADWNQLFACADQRAYAAKQAGRNRVIGAD
jgi:diguanylate cyclase (GGDEF)-like protein